MYTKRLPLLLFLLGALWFTIYGQEPNYERIEILIGDTIVWKNDFHDLGNTLDSNRLVNLSYRRITDGPKDIFYLDGTLYAKGVIKDGKERGLWQFRHRNGRLARIGKFNNGSAYGKHIFWGKDGILSSYGMFRNGTLSGKLYKFKLKDQDALKEIYKKGVYVRGEKLPPTIATRKQGKLLKKVDRMNLERNSQ